MILDIRMVAYYIIIVGCYTCDKKKLRSLYYIPILGYLSFNHTLTHFSRVVNSNYKNKVSAILWLTYKNYNLDNKNYIRNNFSDHLIVSNRFLENGTKGPALLKNR